MIKCNLNERFSRWSDSRNVIDKYKHLSDEEILLKVRENLLEYAVCMQHIQGDFNISSVIRNANAFGARKVFYYGKKHIDRRGAVGVYKYTPVKYLDSFQELKEIKNDYSFVGLELVKEAISIQDFSWPKNPLILIGEENSGLSQEVLDLCDYKVYIPMRGSVRSLNAAVASGIIMNDFCKKYTF